MSAWFQLLVRSVLRLSLARAPKPAEYTRRWVHSDVGDRRRITEQIRSTIVDDSLAQGVDSKNTAAGSGYTAEIDDSPISGRVTIAVAVDE